MLFPSSSESVILGTPSRVSGRLSANKRRGLIENPIVNECERKVANDAERYKSRVGYDSTSKYEISVIMVMECSVFSG
jgi:hypothetical protein